MIDTGYLYSKDEKRIFVNTCLGCTGKCDYCYLGKIGYDNKSVVSELKKAEDLIAQIEELGISKDTLISIGCFSECFDDVNKPETIKLLRHFLQRGNQIQLSTKREVKLEEVQELESLVQYLGQLVIYVSSATISKWHEFESGTDEPRKRFKTFEISQKVKNIPTVLYMKPVLKGITIQDLELYKEVITKYQIRDVVVGSIFGEKESQETVPFLNDRILFYNPNTEELKIKQNLMQLDNVRVFSRGTQVMKYYREKQLERYQ